MSEARFAEYEFENDEKWKTYASNIMLADGSSLLSAVRTNQSSPLIEKFKRKYYNNNVEPISLQSPSSTQSTTSNNDNNTSSNNTNSSSSTSSANSSNTTSNASNSSSTTRGWFDVLKSRSGILLLLNLNIAVIGTFSLLSFIIPSLQLFYRQTILTAIVVYFCSIGFNGGFNMTNFQTQLQQKVDGQYLLLAVMFLSTSPSFLFLVNLIIFSLYSSISLFSAQFRGYTITIPKLQQLIQFLQQNQRNAVILIANNEFLLLIMHLVDILIASEKNFIRCLMICNFIIQRRQQSPELRLVMSMMKKQFETLIFHPKCPRLITSVYQWIQNQFEKLQQTIAQAQAARNQ